MSFDRLLLALLTVFVLLAGLGCIIAPGSFAQQVGFSATASGTTEIRAFYGGLQLGIGSFLIWCLREAARIRTGLFLGAFAVGGAGVARALGMVLDQAPTAYHVANLAIEVVTVALIVIAVSRTQRPASGSAT